MSPQSLMTTTQVEVDTWPEVWEYVMTKIDDPGFTSVTIERGSYALFSRLAGEYISEEDMAKEWFTIGITSTHERVKPR